MLLSIFKIVLLLQRRYFRCCRCRAAMEKKGSFHSVTKSCLHLVQLPLVPLTCRQCKMNCLSKACYDTNTWVRVYDVCHQVYHKNGCNLWPLFCLTFSCIRFVQCCKKKKKIEKRVDVNNLLQVFFFATKKLNCKLQLFVVRKCCIINHD